MVVQHRFLLFLYIVYSRRCQSTSYFAFSFLVLPGKHTPIANLHNESHRYFCCLSCTILLVSSLFGHYKVYSCNILLTSLPKWNRQAIRGQVERTWFVIRDCFVTRLTLQCFFSSNCLNKLSMGTRRLNSNGKMTADSSRTNIIQEE